MLAGEDSPTERPFVGAQQGLADHDERLHCRRVGRREVQAATGQQRQVEFGRGEEVFQVDGLVVGRLQRRQIFFAQRDALLGAVGIALDDLVGRHAAVFGAALVILDVFAAASVELTQRHGRIGTDRGVSLDGHTAGAEPQLAGPTGAAGGWRGRHGRRINEQRGGHGVSSKR